MRLILIERIEKLSDEEVLSEIMFGHICSSSIRT